MPLALDGIRQRLAVALSGRAGALTSQRPKSVGTVLSFPFRIGFWSHNQTRILYNQTAQVQGFSFFRLSISIFQGLMFFSLYLELLLKTKLQRKVGEVFIVIFEFFFFR